MKAEPRHGENVRYCFVELQDVVVAFEATHIECFLDDEDQEDRADLDVAEALGIPLAPGSIGRRRAVLQQGYGPRNVALGERIQLKPVSGHLVVPLPVFVRELGCGVSGILGQQDGFAFVIDLQRMMRAQREQSSGPESSQGELA